MKGDVDIIIQPCVLTSLINPQDKQVEIYRQNQLVEVVNIPIKLSGEDFLPGFELQM